MRMSPYSNMKPNILDYVQLRYNYRLDPWPRHRAALGKAFGCARVVFNDGLHARQQAHKAGRPYLTDSELSARLTVAKKTPERQWLGEVSVVVLQQALADLNAAYRNFFASIKGTRKGPKIEKPRFRSRKDHRQARPRMAVRRVRGVARPGHQRGGERREGRRAGGEPDGLPPVFAGSQPGRPDPRALPLTLQ